jgi:anti-sigma B factor antagonist
LGEFFVSLDVPFGITSEVGPGVATVVVRGEVDLENVTDLRSTLDEVVATTNGDIVIDLAEVSYLDSSGLHELLSARDHLAALDRRFIVRRPSPIVLRLFEICDVSELFAGSTDGDVAMTSQPVSDQGISVDGDNSAARH